MRVYICIQKRTQDDISSISLLRVNCSFLSDTDRAAETVEMSLSPLWNISAPEASYWPFLPPYIYCQPACYYCSGVSCISYSLSFSHSVLRLFHTLELYFCASSISPPSLFSSLLFLPLLLSVTSHLSPSDVMSLVSLSRVYLMVDLSWCDGSFLSSVCERVSTSVYFVSCLPLGGKCPDHSFCCVYFLPLNQGFNNPTVLSWNLNINNVKQCCQYSRRSLYLKT